MLLIDLCVGLHLSSLPLPTLRMYLLLLTGDQARRPEATSGQQRIRRRLEGLGQATDGLRRGVGGADGGNLAVSDAAARVRSRPYRVVRL